jgi:pimeloyl-ACP methyl ester carboxylesterase
MDDGVLALWKGYGTRQGSPLLLIQGFSLEDDEVGTYEVYHDWFDLAQALRQRGRDVWVLTFPDVRGPVAGDALLIQSALEKLLDPALGYAKVNLLGHSLGGLAARYALAQDEAKSPQGASAGRVGIFASVDAPQQGMNVHLAMEAALWQLDATAMLSPALQNMLYTWMGATNFSTDQCHFPEPGSFHATTAAHDAFYDELNALNGDGYPHQSRNIAVAAGTMVPRSQKTGAPVYRLKASISAFIGRIGLCDQDYKASEIDVLPGALFPGQILPDRFDSGPVRVELTTFMDPTMVPSASAIDLRNGVSKFDRVFLPALPAGTLLRHADPIPGASEWLLQQFTELP